MDAFFALSRLQPPDEPERSVSIISSLSLQNLKVKKCNDSQETVSGFLDHVPEVPEEILVHIFCFLPLRELVQVSMCCKDFRRIATDVGCNFHPLLKLFTKKDVPPDFCLIRLSDWKKMVFADTWGVIVHQWRYRNSQEKMQLCPTLRATIAAIGRATNEQEPTHVLYPVVNFLCDVHNEHWHDSGETKCIAVKNLFSLLMAFPKYLVVQSVLLRDFINKLFELGIHSTLGSYAEETIVQLCITLGTAETEMTATRLTEIFYCLLLDRPNQRVMMIKSVFTLFLQFPWFLTEQRQIAEICFKKLVEFMSHPRVNEFSIQTLTDLCGKLRQCPKVSKERLETIREILTNLSTSNQNHKDVLQKAITILAQ